MKRTSRVSTALAALALATLTSSAPALAQSGGQRATIQTRIAALEGRLVSSNGGADDARSELERLRRRLTEGDFRAGDAIVLQVTGEETLTGTFPVDPPRVLRLPGMDPIDLGGVLYDELEGHLGRELGRYLREPELKAHGLIRLGVLGAVGQPGYYQLRPNTPLLDVFSAAGGLAHEAKIEDVELRRGGEAIVKSDAFRQAMASGWDLQSLDARAGDEVYVPAGTGPIRPRDMIYIISGIVGLTTTILALTGAI